MNTPFAFRASFADLKVIKTRQVVQLCFELPLADFDSAYQILGGLPDPAAERWFGIAPLNVTLRENIIDEPDQKQRKEWRTLQPSAQAGIRCAEPLFWAFIREEHKAQCVNTDDAASFVRDHCKVNSRAHFNSNPAAKAVWQSLDNQFQAWKASQ